MKIERENFLVSIFYCQKKKLRGKAEKRKERIKAKS